jgi:cytochrome c-type biogenesis protein CcmH/NrfF
MPKLRKKLHAASALLAVGLLLVAMAFAETPEARFDRLGHKLMCRCGCNQILLECNHVGCQYSDKMRQELMAAISGPNNDDLILQGFVQEYGAVVLAAPTDKGFNRVAWIAPFAALGLGIFAVVLVVRRWKAQTPQAAVATGPAPAALDDFREQARKETEL